MNSEEVGGVVRAVVAALGGVAVTKGWTDASTVTALAGAAATIAVAVWSIVAKRRARA